MKIAFLSWAAIAWISTVNGCGSKKRGEQHPSPGPAPQPSENVISRFLGDGVIIGQYDGSGFVGQADINALNCDFDGPCCWKNAQPPVDQLEFLTGSGAVDPTKLQQNFGTSSGPIGNFLVVAMSEAAAPADKAVFFSCLTCGQDVQVTLIHYTSPGVRLQACMNQGTSNAPVECQDFSGTSGVPDSVHLQGGQPGSSVAIVASNLVDPSGSIAVVDSIQVQGEACSGGCKDVTCDFNSDLCKFQPLGGSGSAAWKIAGPGLFTNPATGVRGSVDGTTYAAVYVPPGQSADMAVDTTLFTGGERFLRFQEYKATEGLRFAGCCDTTQQCTYDTGGGVLKSDFGQWFQAGFSCPAGTKKIIFHAENKGNNFGAIGVDNLQVFQTAQDTQPLC